MWHLPLSKYCFCQINWNSLQNKGYKNIWVRLDYATTHHDPPLSTPTHHQPKYIHHHPPLAKKYPPVPIIFQKMDHHPAKAKIYPYTTSFRHYFNSFFFFKMQYSFPWRRFCKIKFLLVRFSNSKFLLHSVTFYNI